MAKTSSTHSHLRTVTDFAAAQRDVPVPRGFDFDDPYAKTRWDQYTSSRAKAEWRTAELIQLAKMVETDIKIRDMKETLENDGDLVSDRFGVLKPHPYFEMIAKLERQRDVFARVLVLSKGGGERVQVHKRALKAQAEANSTDDDLLAKPSGD